MKEILKEIKDEFIQHPWIMTKMLLKTVLVIAFSIGIIIYAATLKV